MPACSAPWPCICHQSTLRVDVSSPCQQRTPGCPLQCVKCVRRPRSSLLEYEFQFLRIPFCQCACSSPCLWPSAFSSLVSGNRSRYSAHTATLSGPHCSECSISMWFAVCAGLGWRQLPHLPYLPLGHAPPVHGHPSPAEFPMLSANHRLQPSLLLSFKSLCAVVVLQCVCSLFPLLCRFPVTRPPAASSGSCCSPDTSVGLHCVPKPSDTLASVCLDFH